MAIKLLTGADSFNAKLKPHFDTGFEALTPKTMALIKHYESLGCMILDCDNSEIRLVGLDNMERCINVSNSYVVDGVVVDDVKSVDPLTLTCVDLHYTAMTPNNTAMDQLKTTIADSGQQILYSDSDSVFVELDEPATLEQRIREIFGPDNLTLTYEGPSILTPISLKRYRAVKF